VLGLRSAELHRKPTGRACVRTCGCKSGAQGRCSPKTLRHPRADTGLGLLAELARALVQRYRNRSDKKSRHGPRPVFAGPLQACSGSGWHLSERAHSEARPRRFALGWHALFLLNGGIDVLDSATDWEVRRTRAAATDWKSVVRELLRRTGSPSYKGKCATTKTSRRGFRIIRPSSYGFIEELSPNVWTMG
jgi:hypothetical protein